MVLHRMRKKAFKAPERIFFGLLKLRKDVSRFLRGPGFYRCAAKLASTQAVTDDMLSFLHDRFKVYLKDERCALRCHRCGSDRQHQPACGGKAAGSPHLSLIPEDGKTFGGTKRAANILASRGKKGAPPLREPWNPIVPGRCGEEPVHHHQFRPGDQRARCDP